MKRKAVPQWVKTDYAAIMNRDTIPIPTPPPGEHMHAFVVHVFMYPLFQTMSMMKWFLEQLAFPMCVCSAALVKLVYVYIARSNDAIHMCYCPCTFVYLRYLD